MSRQCTHYGRWPQHGFTSLKKLKAAVGNLASYNRAVM
ncbi:insAB' transposase [Shigella flexneri K-315]|uniref:InsAB' transposase n=1 Tax=Shigella flexneri K-315 TaxID=766150 RepID=I6CVK1_SHIFL|nr:insAB' transposase [Shigella flexneri K-315]